jgi:predicted nucleotidyltransferase
VSIQQTFTAALDALVAQIKDDRSILAALLCGSLSHDTVWAKSDIDLVLVTVDDRKVESGDIALYADGVNVHALLMPRAQFRRTIEGAVTNSVIHSFLAKGRLLYTHDPSIEELCAHLRPIGGRDTQIYLLGAGTSALACLHKAHKWFLTRGDLDYTALWILYAATSFAQIEVVSRGLLADREVIPQAALLNPSFFRTVYTGLLNTKKTKADVKKALAAADAFIRDRIEQLFGPIEDYLRDAGEARSAGEIEAWFKQHYDVSGVTTACEYLSDEGRIAKVSMATRLTKKSTADVQELAFVHLPR